MDYKWTKYCFYPKCFKICISLTLKQGSELTAGLMVGLNISEESEISKHAALPVFATST